MQFHTLKKTTKNKKRVGRGGKRGTTAGRGTKGQRARAGHKIRPAIRDLIKKIPKKRGVKFSGSGDEAITITLSLLEENFSDGEKVTPKVLAERGLITLPRTKGTTVKVLNKGTLSKRLICDGIHASQKAAERIIELGGELRNIS